MSVINTNITSMIGQSNLSKSQNALQTSMERLSSGLRINSAKDDAAGQAIANRFTSQITGLGQAQRNANDGISIAQTAEGGLNQVNDNLQRVRELTVQAQNGTNSASDLDSIQDEINQRMAEIDRISAETDFNGTKVLSSDNGLSIQVGADDGQTISVNLQQITASTLGLNGFNVNGSGESDNATATVTNIQANGGTEALASGGGEWGVVTNHDAAKFEDLLSNMQDGNTVAVSGATTTATYTFNADSGNFSFNNNVTASGGGTEAADFAQSQNFTPANGTKTGTYEVAGGDTATFEITSTGAVTLNGEAAYITATGELTNNSGAGAQAATIENLVATTASDGNTLNIDGTEYVGQGDGTITFSDTASTAQVEAALTQATADSTVTLGDGFAERAVNITAGGTTSDDTYVDGNDALTTVAGFRTEYNVNDETGEVTVAGTYTLADTDGSNTMAGTKYEQEVGATVYVSGGQLTTDETTAGDATENPLSTLDDALAMVDSLRSELGAVQNRFESAITNLQTNETNLSAARSRIEDADYATEVANMTRAQILQQAGTSVLAQANQLPQNVLSLLG
ncbi:flagellin FliC [Halomonas sp. 7T]|uniref:flagellin N-terminal helical domain-containing protein n=1 Tax=Halomonas sp. 7T TaxID=2893469 RepID=UPI0021D84322|nr:flagellin [Halomonas sp. 7T]UXZ54258.1 flagellin FliC [Halomonas sp. 7T]